MEHGRVFLKRERMERHLSLPISESCRPIRAGCVKRPCSHTLLAVAVGIEPGRAATVGQGTVDDNDSGDDEEHDGDAQEYFHGAAHVAASTLRGLGLARNPVPAEGLVVRLVPLHMVRGRKARPRLDIVWVRSLNVPRQVVEGVGVLRGHRARRVHINIHARLRFQLVFPSTATSERGVPADVLSSKPPVLESRRFGIRTAVLLLGKKAWPDPDIDSHGCVDGVGDVIGGSRNAMPDQGGSTDRLNQTRASNSVTKRCRAHPVLRRTGRHCVNKLGTPDKSAPPSLSPTQRF